MCCRDAARTQSGGSLLEVLISIVVIGIVVGGLTTGLVAMVRSSAQGNDAARANVLVSGFGDALKDLTYQRCESTAGDTVALAELYQDEFEATQADLPLAKRLLRNDGDSVSTVDVDVVCTPTDQGVQTITYEVTSRSVTREAQVSKRNPEFEGSLVPRFTATQVTDDGDPLVIFELDASSSGPSARIASYVFDCDVDDPDNGEIVVADPVDAQAVCEYPAPTTDGVEKTISLRLIDTFGDSTTPVDCPVRPTLRCVTKSLPRVESVRSAQVSVSATCTSPTQSAITPATPCQANPSRNVDFTVTSTLSSGRIVSYEWNFGDPDSGDANKFKSGSPTASHVYSRSGSPNNRFTVTGSAIDEVGGRYAFSIDVYIQRPGPPPPIASLTLSPNPAIAKQTMRFNGTGSSAASGATIVTYSWDFGLTNSSGDTSIEPEPRFTYNDPGTYVVTLTVTDSNGRAASTSANVVVGSLWSPDDPRINFRLTRLKGCFLGFQWFGCSASATFSWTNGPSAGNDELRYQMEIRWDSGICFAFNTESKDVRAGAPGTAQTFVYTFRGASDVCPGDYYSWRVRTIRNSAEDGSFVSNWTAWTSVRAVS